MDKIAILAAGFIDLTPDGVDYHVDEYLLIEGGYIVGFDKVENLPDGVKVIDRSDCYSLPGLIDAGFLPGLILHDDGSRPNSLGESVWQAKKASEAWLALGVTSVASMGTAEEMDFELANSIAGGRLKGPRLAPALSPIVPLGETSFHWLYGVKAISGAQDARRATRELIKNGADRIVVYADVPLEFHADPRETSRHRLCVSLDELTEIVTQANQAGCFVHAQAISSQAIDICIAAKVRSIGCAFGLEERHIPALVENHIAIAPNLALGATVGELGATNGFSDAVIHMVTTQRISPDLLLHAQECGVEIIIGTNGAFMAGDVYRECLELNKAGLSPMQTLRAATQHSARAIRSYVQCGSLRPQQFADLMFVEGDPLQDIQSLGDVCDVMLEGTLI